MNLEAAIEKTRRELLELSARNRLIHTPLEGKRKSWLAIDDEHSDQLFDLLIRQKKAMSFLPKPMKEEESEQNDSNADENVHANATEPQEEVVSDSDVDLHERHTDRNLQTTLEKEKLQDRLLRTFYDARTAEEEQGVSILYLACGFLKWRESDSSEVNRYAPLLLIPVELTRNTARSLFRLKFREDEIVTNLSIQARLLEDFGLRLPDLPEDLLDNEAWSPSLYFQEVREIIDQREGWEVLENQILLWFFSFTKFLMFRDLNLDAWPDEFDLRKNALIRGLLGEGFGSETDRSPFVGEDEPIDSVLSPADVIHVADADSSQAVVIEEIIQGRNLVVQGPPGTGKSQTITNVIAAAVHAGKRVLFVSEKMAALNVVKRRLDQIGLGPMTVELHSHKARKRGVLADLKSTFESGVPTGRQSVATDELRHAAQQLRDHDERLHDPVGNSGCSPYQAIGRLLRAKSTDSQPLPYLVPEMTAWTLEDYQSRQQMATDLDQLLAVSGDPSIHVWRGVQCAPMTPFDLERLIGQLAKLGDCLERLNTANNELAERLGLPKAADLKGLSLPVKLAIHVQNCPERFDHQAIGTPSWETELPRLEKALANISKLIENRNSLADCVSEAAWDMEWGPTRIALAAHGKSWFRFLRPSFRQAMTTLRGVFNGTPPKEPDERVKLVDTILTVQRASKKVKQDEELGRSLLGQLWQGEATPVSDANALITWVKKGVETPFLRQHQRDIVGTLEDRTILADPAKRIAEEVKLVDSGFAELVATLKLNLQTAFDADEPSRVPLSDWQARIQHWIESPEQLSHYLSVWNRIETLRESGLPRLAEEIERGEVNAGEVETRLDRIRCEAVLKGAWRDRPQLADFHGITHEELRTRFGDLDRQRIVLSRLLVAKKHHENLPSPSVASGQVRVVAHEMNKKSRHKSIRRLLREAGQAVQKIKPVFMMSPLSVAQYLEPGAVEFDLLVMDEASQIQPVDALGAIARCKQIAVVGDQKQLPPTNFFGRISGENEITEEEEDTVDAGDMESILGLCEAQGLPCRMLRWHYRSRHESLIAVSNQQFYDNRLFIVPSPIANGGPLGLKFRYVPEGWYDRGGSRTNRNEAIEVAEAVIEHARNHPELSLGVATFSSAQRDAIIDEIERRRRDDPAIEEFFTDNRPEPFFVKSLENVQGDQRDVIYISIGYAKDQAGYFSQHFGPLNRKGGERRLNVLISRAASACEVFTSIKADDIDLSRTQSEGVVALKMYLNYAEHGHLDAVQSHGDADSVFEEQVAQALRDQGLEVDHQIGVGGFLIDLAIRDPKRRGRYVLGIECDGAQYHRARWVRDRDRLRQQILEARGWIIHRIWSTDWFQRPEEQLERVLDACENAKAHWEERDAAETEEAMAMSLPTVSQSVEGDLHWERIEKTEEECEEENGLSDTTYEEADFTVRDFDGQLMELQPSQLSQLMKRIAEIEAPIHLEEIGRRCITILGSGRLVASFKENVELTAKHLEQKNLVVRKGEFIYLPDMQTFPVRNRRSLENANLRKLEYVAPEEIREAIVTVVTEHIGTDEAETITAVAKLLGIGNSPSFQEVIKTHLDQLTDENALETRSGKFFV